MKIASMSLLAIAGLIFASDLRCQLRWHTVVSSHVDTNYFAFNSISSSGLSCVAVGETWGKASFNTSTFFISRDGGITWSIIDSLSQGNILFHNIQQLDSNNAIAMSSGGQKFIRSLDDWNSWMSEPPVPSLDTLQGQIIYPNIEGINFASISEGIIDIEFGFYMTTIDGGNHWKKVNFEGGIAYRSYGAGTFRVYASPQAGLPPKIFTTHDNWATVDTTIVTLNGPFLDIANVKPSSLQFGAGDTLAIVGTRWDSSHLHFGVMMARSTDLGSTWSDMGLPPNLEILPKTVSPFDAETIVIAGVDSVGRIVISTDRGATWQVDTVPLDDGAPYYWVKSIAVSGSGRVIATIISDSNYLNSNYLVYLEPTVSAVQPDSIPQDIILYPNPAANILNLRWGFNKISILDPLGRAYSVPRNGNTLDVSSLPAGIYFIVDGGSTTGTPQSAKFVKE